MTIYPEHVDDAQGVAFAFFFMSLVFYLLLTTPLFIVGVIIGLWFALFPELLVNEQ